MDIGTGSFTAEFWFKLDNFGGSHNHTFICTSTSQAAQGSAGEIIIIIEGNYLKAWWWTGSSMTSDSWTINSAVNTSDWHHMALVRSGTAHDLYVGKAGNATGAKISSTKTHTAYSVGGEGDDWVLGRLRDSTTLSSYSLTGQLDEVLITKAARYSGSTYTLPAAPYTGGDGSNITTTHLYCSDSVGNEYQLTKD